MGTTTDHNPSDRSIGAQQAEDVVSVRSVLIAARKLIEKPENWTQGCFARDAKGRHSFVETPNAVCFCMSGAIARVCDYNGYQWERALGALARGLPSGSASRLLSVVEFNDDTDRTHAEVLAAFDKAIAECEQQSPTVGHQLSSAENEIGNGPHPPSE